MELSLDTGGTTKYRVCPRCKSKYLYLQRFVLDRGDAFAVCSIEAHRHNDAPEIYLTCTLGGEWEDDNPSNNVTFACRYGEVEGHKDYACTLLDVPTDFAASFAGKKLTRKEGLKHEKINEFWHVIDFLIESDLTIHDFLFHPRKSKIKNLLRF